VSRFFVVAPLLNRRGEMPYMEEPYVDSFTFDEILSVSWGRHSKTESEVALPCAKIDEASKKVSLTIPVEVPKKAYTYHAAKGDYQCGGVIKILRLRQAP